MSVGLPPFVILQMIAGESGEDVKILGQGFTGTSAVAFAGTPAAFEVVSDTLLVATVPAAAGSGRVTCSDSISRTDQ